MLSETVCTVLSNSRSMRVIVRQQPHSKATEKIVRNRIFGGIGVFWGGGLLVSKLISGQWVSGSGAYASGQIGALVFSILLFGVGLYYLIKGGSKSTTGGSQPPAA